MRDLRACARELLEQIDTLEGVEFSRDLESYKAEACWDDAVSRLRAALGASAGEKQDGHEGRQAGVNMK